MNSNLVHGTHQQSNKYMNEKQKHDIIQEMDDHLMNLHESVCDFDEQGQLKIYKLMRIWCRNYTSKGAALLRWRVQTRINEENYLEEKWQQNKQSLIDQQRYPFNSMSKQRRQFEIDLFDLERKQFFKHRSETILKTVFRIALRKERTLKVVAFHKFITNTSLLQVGWQSMRQAQPLKQINKSPINQRSKSPMQQPQKSSSMTSLQQKQLLKYKAAQKLLQFGYKLNTKLQTRKATLFLRWFRQMQILRQISINEELSQMNFILNERVFREQLFRTKLRIQKSDIDSKLQQTQEIMQALNLVMK